ncbi:hypothetical protein LNA01_01090 [Companilactobacillus nantensis]|nr:hypothetical protein LNA01_01090 [Companilactobacillus nantensis]
MKPFHYLMYRYLVKSTFKIMIYKNEAEYFDETIKCLSLIKKIYRYNGSKIIKNICN